MERAGKGWYQADWAIGWQVPDGQLDYPPGFPGPKYRASWLPQERRQFHVPVQAGLGLHPSRLLDGLGKTPVAIVTATAPRFSRFGLPFYAAGKEFFNSVLYIHST